MQGERQMPQEDERQATEEAVDEAIRTAGGDPRATIRMLLVDLAEARAALALGASRGYLRGRAPGGLG